MGTVLKSTEIKEAIALFLAAGWPPAKMARMLRRDVTTVYRHISELRTQRATHAAESRQLDAALAGETD